MPGLLSEMEIAHELPSVPTWSRDGSAIACKRVFRDFAEAMNYVNRVAVLAEIADHHPDIDIRWNAIRLCLTTHSKGGLTEKDFALARQIDALI